MNAYLHAYAQRLLHLRPELRGDPPLRPALRPQRLLRRQLRLPPCSRLFRAPLRQLQRPQHAIQRLFHG